jgi:hypothetical protein
MIRRNDDYPSGRGVLGKEENNLTLLTLSLSSDNDDDDDFKTFSFCQNVYSSLPIIDGQLRATINRRQKIQYNGYDNNFFDDQTFKCVVPLIDNGGTTIVTLIETRERKKRTAGDFEKVFEYIADTFLEYQVGTDEFKRINPNKKARNVRNSPRFDARIDAVVLLVSSTLKLREFLDEHLITMRRASISTPIIIGYLNVQIKNELKRELHHYTDNNETFRNNIAMIFDASSITGIQNTFVKKLFSQRVITRLKNKTEIHNSSENGNGIDGKKDERLCKSVQLPSSSSRFTRFFGATVATDDVVFADTKSENTWRKAGSRGLMAPDYSKKSDVVMKLFSSSRKLSRKSLQSLAMAFFLVFSLGFIIIETRLPDISSRGVSKNKPRRASSSSSSSSRSPSTTSSTTSSPTVIINYKTYPTFGMIDVSEDSASSLEIHEVCASTKMIVLDSSATSKDDLARIVVSDELAPKNIRKPECAPIVREIPTDGGALYQTIDGKSPSGPRLVSPGVIITHPDRVFIYAPPTMVNSNKKKILVSSESMTFEFPCAKNASSRILKFSVIGRQQLLLRSAPFFKTRLQTITSGADARTIKNVQISAKSEEFLETKCRRKKRCTITASALRGAVNFSSKTIESANNFDNDGGVSFPLNGSATATSSSLEALKELLSGIEYIKPTEMRTGEDVMSITLTYDDDENDKVTGGIAKSYARAEQARVLIHVRAACVAKLAKVAGDGIGKHGNVPGTLATIDVFCKDGLGHDMKGDALRGGENGPELILEVTHGSDVTQTLKFGIAPDSSCYRAKFVRPTTDYEVTVFVDGVKSSGSPRYVAIENTNSNNERSNDAESGKQQQQQKQQQQHDNKRQIIPARHSEDVQEALHRIAEKERAGNKWKAASHARNWRPLHAEVIGSDERNKGEKEVVEEEDEDIKPKQSKDYEEDDAKEEKLKSGLDSFLEKRKAVKADSERLRLEDAIKKAKVPVGESKFVNLKGRAPVSNDMVVIETEAPFEFKYLSLLSEDEEDEAIPRPVNPTKDDFEMNENVKHGKGEYVHLHKEFHNSDGDDTNNSNEEANDDDSVPASRIKQSYKAHMTLDSKDGVFKFDRLEIEKIRNRDQNHKHLDGHV